VNGKETSSCEQILDPEQSQILEFGLSELKSGKYTVELGGLSGEFSSSVWINWWLIIGIILAIIAIYWLVRWYATRKKHSNQNT
ncbi:MAG: hypothetical protein NUV31_11995, partial [Dehalococcoidales bacterium]|nr:hypothetical protein [Dehalococcoidales bacterium]